MFHHLKKLGLAAGLASMSLLTAQPAQARDRGDNDAAIAIGAGIIGLAIGAAIADRGDDRYYDRRYYPSRRYVTVRGRPGYYYYYQGNPNRYYRDRYYTRYYQPYYRERYSRGRYRNDYRYDRRDYRRRYRDDRRDYRRDYRDGRRDYRRDRRDDRWRGRR